MFKLNLSCGLGLLNWDNKIMVDWCCWPVWFKYCCSSDELIVSCCAAECWMSCGGHFSSNCVCVSIDNPLHYCMCKDLYLQWLTINKTKQKNFSGSSVTCHYKLFSHLKWAASDQQLLSIGDNKCRSPRGASGFFCWHFLGAVLNLLFVAPFFHCCHAGRTTCSATALPSRTYLADFFLDR